METPSSTRRVTRSQTLAASNNSIQVCKVKNEELEKSVCSKTRTRNGKQQQERSVLIDITNDSPIVGVAMETPSSAIAKQRNSKAKNMMMTTPGSGEALLRGLVKTLLQKVEEEAELSKVSMEKRSFLHLQGCVNSPMELLAPTPANTPQVPNLSEGDDHCGLGSVVLALPVVEEKFGISGVVSGMLDHEMKQEVSVITRSLLVEFSEKSESSDASEYSSVVTDQELITGESSATKDNPSLDDDNSSIWSIQVNASACHDYEDQDQDQDQEAIEEILADDDYYDDNEEDEVDGGLLDELCEDMGKISMEEMFTGKHTRFVYTSDDEIEECLERDEDCCDGNGILRLKGLPTPKGKHLRFSEE